MWGHMHCLATQLLRLEEDIVGLRDEWRELRKGLAKNDPGTTRLVFVTSRQDNGNAATSAVTSGQQINMTEKIARVLQSDEFMFEM